MSWVAAGRALYGTTSTAVVNGSARTLATFHRGKTALTAGGRTLTMGKRWKLTAGAVGSGRKVAVAELKNGVPAAWNLLSRGQKNFAIGTTSFLGGVTADRMLSSSSDKTQDFDAYAQRRMRRAYHT